MYVHMIVSSIFSIRIIVSINSKFYPFDGCPVTEQPSH